MKWISIITSAKQEVYELWQENQKLLSLIYNEALGIARVNSNDLKRTFMIGKEGFLKSKTVLRNEYGIKMGQLEYEKYNSSEGFIDMNGEKFFYNIQTDSSTELHIYKTTNYQPFVNCSLTPSRDEANTVKKDDDLHHTTYPCLIMALCWYMFLPITKENVIAARFNDLVLSQPGILKN